MVKNLLVPDRWEAFEKLSDGAVHEYYTTWVTQGCERSSILLTALVGVSLDGTEEFMLSTA